MNTQKKIPAWIALPSSGVAWVLAALFTMFFFTVGLIVYPFFWLIERDKGGAMHAIAVMWARSIMLVNPLWVLKVTGHENIEPGKHYVVVGNHQSMLDILVVLAGLPLHFKFIAKKELFPIPFIGWHMSLAGYIPLDRDSRKSGKATMEKAAEWVARKVSVLFFPEGTRSADGEIQAFKSGAFKIAFDQKVDVLPLVIDGTGAALPKNSRVHTARSPLLVAIQKPVSSASAASVDELKEKVRAQMAGRLAEIRRA